MKRQSKMSITEGDDFTCLALFDQKSKNILFTIIYNIEKQRILSSEMLESEHWIIFLSVN